MLNKKLMFLVIFFISLIAVSAVSAQDVNNDTAVGYGSQDLHDLCIDEDITTGDVLGDGVADNKTATIDCVQEENFLVVRVFDGDGKSITEGDLTFTSEDGDLYTAILAGNPYFLLNLYNFEYGEFPQNISIDFVNSMYSANTSIFCTLNNTIIAHDVYNESSFPITFLGNDYLPINGWTMGITIDDGDMFYHEFNIFTDEYGQILLDLALEPGNYTVIADNRISGQRSIFNWNVTQRDSTKESKINVTSDGYNIFFNIVDGLNNTAEDVYFDMYINGEFEMSVTKSFNFFSLGEGSYSIDLFYDDLYYYPSNASLVVDVIDVIKVNDSFYNTTIIDALFLDYNGNPLINGTYTFYNDLGVYYGFTDENGHAICDLNLMPGVYEIKVVHDFSKQYKMVRLEVLEEYDYKRAFINVTQDKLRFIINVTDFYGNAVDGGNIVVYNDFIGTTIPIHNGTVVYSYDEGYLGPYIEREKSLFIELHNNDYYFADVVYRFDFVNTIISEDVLPGKVFNATFLDMDKNPVSGMEVIFEFSSHLDGRYEYLGNMTVGTDENGVASLEIPDKYFDWIVSFDNPFTGQIKRNIWINKEIVNMTPVFDYFDESSEIYYINGHVILFKLFPSDAGGSVFIDGEYLYDVPVINGTFKIWVPELGEFDWAIYYVGDSKYNASLVYYTMVLCEMDLPNMTISEDLVVDYLNKANFTVNLVNGTNPIVNASVEIKMGNNTYVMQTDENGNISMPISVDAGKYDVFVNYKGSPSYVHVNKTTTLTVKKDSSLTLCDVTLDYGSLAYVVVAVEGARGIAAKIGDVNESVVGNAIVISDLDAGNYTLTVTTIPDDAHYAVTRTANITVNKVSTVLAASAVTATYNVDKNLVITLKDNQNRPISGLQLSVVFNGSKKLTTDKNGQVKVSTSGAVPKTYSVSITFAGDNNYLKSTKSVKVTVKKATPKLTANAKTFKKSVKTKKYTITLKNNKNKIMKNAKVTLKVKGKTYNAKTNGKGQAIFKITNLNKKGKFTAVVKYAGSKYYTAKTVKPKITVQ